MTEIECVHRDEAGYCRFGKVLIDTDGTPHDWYGEKFDYLGTASVQGWGHLSSDTATAWVAPSGTYMVFIP